MPRNGYHPICLWKIVLGICTAGLSFFFTGVRKRTGIPIINILKYLLSPVPSPVNPPRPNNPPPPYNNRFHADMGQIDAMDGHAFEYFVAELLKKLGYSNVSVTRGSGDQGVDVLAEKDGIRYAVQCKNYSSALGNTPVQEVSAGKEFYNCHVGVVITNNYFTKGAKELAERTRVLLWDRDKLSEMMAQASLTV